MSMPSGTFPNRSHYEMLMRGQRALNDAGPLIAKAEACGVDCAEYKQGFAYLSDTIAAFIREFFPNQIVPPSGSGVATPHE